MFTNYTGKSSRSYSTTDVYRSNEGDDEATRIRTFSTLRRPRTKPPVPPTTQVPSYLSDDNRKKFQSTVSLSSGDLPSPRSDNFVKKLVATLERRQEEEASRTIPRTTSEIYKRSFRQLSRDDRNLKERPLERSNQRLTPLEDLSEDDLEDDEKQQESDRDNVDEEEDEDHYVNEADQEYFTEIWKSQQPAETVKPSKMSMLKSVFTSLINWRIGGKSLPKGSRDYYATRESLGEEMRAFRRDTMPQLMNQAAQKSQLPELMLPKIKSNERPRRDTQDFAKLLKARGNQRQQPDQQEQEANSRSTASIHPVYGRTTGGWTIRQLDQLQSSEVQRPPWVRPAPPIVQLPAEERRSQVSLDEHLIRPSRLRQMQSQPGYDYDVPRSNRPVNRPASLVQYQNVFLQTQNVNMEPRNRCTSFTSFEDLR